MDLFTFRQGERPAKFDRTNTNTFIEQALEEEKSIYNEQITWNVICTVFIHSFCIKTECLTFPICDEIVSQKLETNSSLCTILWMAANAMFSEPLWCQVLCSPGSEERGEEVNELDSETLLQATSVQETEACNSGIVNEVSKQQVIVQYLQVRTRINLLDLFYVINSYQRRYSELCNPVGFALLLEFLEYS